ncbi:MAG: response regulator transcription factor [Clostridia bacterium]|nr:response regulator transcription factor [Clostridia bacterium]MBQ4626018.1 response regulator transcription factor [Clostridia bacterium]
MPKILVVEDDTELNRTVCAYLNRNGFETYGSFNANEAYDILYEKTIDLIISDIMMPGTDGFEFARAVRETNKEIPILFMTARDDFMSKRMGYAVGIDDYVVKPVDLDELVLRIGALLRRAKIASSRKLEIGKLMLDSDEHTAYYDGEEIQLTVREFDLVFKLLSYPKKTFTRSQLMDEFWDIDTNSGTRTVDVYMTKIRDKFSCCSEFEIVTVHGLGYKAVIKI